MAWVNVQVLGKSVLDGGVQRVSLSVSTDDAVPRVHQTQVDIPPGSPVDFFDRSVRALLKTLASRDDARAQADAVAVGVYTPGVDPVPDPDATLKQTFIDNVRLLAQLQKAVSIGLVAADDTRLVTLKSNMQTQFNGLTQAQQLKIINEL